MLIADIGILGCGMRSCSRRAFGSVLSGASREERYASPVHGFVLVAGSISLRFGESTDRSGTPREKYYTSSTNSTVLEY